MAQAHLDLVIQLQALIAPWCHVFRLLMPRPQTQFNPFPAEQMRAKELVITFNFLELSNQICGKVVQPLSA